jgi:hypothetical protein
MAREGIGHALLLAARKRRQPPGGGGGGQASGIDRGRHIGGEPPAEGEPAIDLSRPVREK